MRFLLVGALAGFGLGQPFYVDKSDLLYYLDARGARHEVRSRADWSLRRAHILASMQKVMGPLPGKPRTPPKVRTLEETTEPTYTRRRIEYSTPDGDWVPAYLFVPASGGKHRAAVCLHQTTKIGKSEPAGLGGNSNLHYARELAERGWVTIAPDYPNFGDYRVDPYALGYASATMKGIVNHRLAVDVVAALPQVDPGRIAAVGHSLGGHNSLFLAVFEPRIRAVITSCGFNSFYKYFHGDLTGWSHRGYMPRIAEAYQKSPAQMPFDFTEVLGAIAPRAVFINAPNQDRNFEVSGVEDCVRAAQPVYRLYHSSERLVSINPDAGHEFPANIRTQAYEFLGKVLQAK